MGHHVGLSPSRHGIEDQDERCYDAKRHPNEEARRDEELPEPDDRGDGLLFRSVES
jgi:hypothetical protein